MKKRQHFFNLSVRNNSKLFSIKQYQLVFIVFAFFIFGFKKAHSENSQKPVWAPELETYLLKVLNTHSLPNIAIGVVSTEGLIYEFTSGYRDIESKLPVNNETLYQIGSTSKAFTGAVLAKLRDQGKIDFDAPIVNYWPDFKLKDLLMTQKVTIRDLTGHWTGVGRHDLAFYHRKLPTGGLLNLLPYLDFSNGLRKTFVYNNYMYMAAAHTAEKVSGESFAKLLKEGILIPLQMKKTVTSPQEMKKSNNRSLAYLTQQKKNIPRPYYESNDLLAAGGIFSNIKDLSNWIKMQLSEGQFNGNTIVSKESLAETRKPYSKVMEQVSYGMGWGIKQTPLGDMYLHSGGIDGFQSFISFIPNANLGVIVLMNESEINPQWISKRVWSTLFDQPKLDEVALGLEQKKVEAEENKKKFPDLKARTDFSESQNFVGSFCNALYGKAYVYKENETLMLKLNYLDLKILPDANNHFFVPKVFSKMKYIKFEEESGIRKRFYWHLEESTTNPIIFDRCL